MRKPKLSVLSSGKIINEIICIGDALHKSEFASELAYTGRRRIVELIPV